MFRHFTSYFIAHEIGAGAQTDGRYAEGSVDLEPTVGEP